MSTSYAPCALCGESSFREMRAGTITADAPAEAYFGSSRKETGHYPIVRCEECGLVQMRPHDDAATLARAYAALSGVTHGDADLATARLAQQQVRTIARYSRPPARLLDVGSGPGWFLDAAARAGYEVSGIEPSADGVARTRSQVPRARIIRGVVEDAEVDEASFDVVTLWDVLEHVADPRGVVRRIRKWLVRKGLLALQVPNVGSVTARFFGPRWPLLLREHLTYFDSRTLRRLLESEGYHVVAMRPCIRLFSAEHLLRRLGQVGIPTGSLGPFAERWVIGAFAGEIRVVAENRC